MFSFKQYDFKKYNVSLLTLILILCGIGAFAIKMVEQPGEGLFMKQVIGIVLGLCIAAFVSIVDYHFLSRMFIPLYIVNIGLLVLVKVAGKSINYSQRWISIGGIAFQPSELSKIILVIFLAQFFAIMKDKLNKWWCILLVLVLTAIPTFMILKQPDLSSSLVSVFIFIVMIFAAGLSYKIITPIVAIGVPLGLGLFWYVLQDFQVLLKPYQQERILSLLHPEEHPDQIFQQSNSIAAIQAGGLYGKLLDQSAGSYRAYDSVPISESDFIFSVIGEELGFIGCCLFFALFAIMIYKCIKIAQNAPDYTGYLIALGISALFMFQVFANIGVATAILPNTGLPLPFISSGLSSLIGGFISIGILLNIGIQRKKNRG